MSLRIQGAPLPASPSVRRAEPPRREVDSGETSATASAAPVGVMLHPELPHEPASLPVTEAAPADSGGSSVRGLDAEEARLAAERLRQQMSAQSTPAARVHGNLIAATVLNLLA